MKFFKFLKRSVAVLSAIVALLTVIKNTIDAALASAEAQYNRA